MKTLTKLVITAALMVPFTAQAKHMDVIEMEFVNGCTLSKLMPIVADFNEWGKAYGYSAEIAAPLQSNSLTSYYWLGTSADAASFGAAWDAWRDAQSDSKSVPAKLQARFEDCTINKARRSYDVF
ncbi:MAG: hypothetical protein EX271_12485 [Acidimicrobiales bacterium]|nr:hypothetical protein [Hyphomonadaceae bacterium]RZV36177.1 MAG: hypothetical protein EX271_12485 [Acidimicrobiales bacterium]